MASIHALAVPTFTEMLRGVSAWLDKGVAYAGAKPFDPAALLDARLAPDMFPLAAQIRFSCIQARDSIARLLGEPPEAAAHDETTLQALQAKIAATIAYVEAAPADRLDAAQERPIVLSLPGEITLDMTGLQFLRDWALPQFYFHVVTAYAILRHNGVDLGKRDYVSHVGAYIRSA